MSDPFLPLGLLPLSAHYDVHGRDPQCPVNVDSSRLVSANSGHWLTTCEGAKSTKANAFEAYAPDDGPENGLSGSNRGGGEPLGGQLYPRWRTNDFKDKLSPNRFFEFGAVTPAPAPMSVGDEVFADPWARNQAPDPHVQATSQVVSEPKSPAI